MATRRFCDVCDQPLKPEDDQPLVRAMEYVPVDDNGGRNWPEGQPKPQVVVYLETTNANNKPLTDICIGCKLKVVSDGQTVSKPKPTPIATLQPEVPADSSPPIKPFAAPSTPPSALLPETPPAPPKPPEPIVFEPSMPK